jgi:hypothetical protein
VILIPHAPVHSAGITAKEKLKATRKSTVYFVVNLLATILPFVGNANQFGLQITTAPN